MPQAAFQGPVEFKPGIDRAADSPYTPRWDKSGSVNEVVECH